jgi:hypothetical protein
MKIASRLAAVAIALAVASPAVAQPRTNEGRFGIGVGLATGEFASIGFISDAFPDPGGFAPQLYFPINLTPSFRLEPQIGRVSYKIDDAGGKGALTSLGIGAFYVTAPSQQTDLYLGGRLISSWASETSPPAPFVATKRSGRDTILALVVGGEFLASARFSVGAEAQLNFIAIGDRDVETPGQPDTTDQGGSAFSTQGVLFVRVYLF